MTTVDRPQEGAEEVAAPQAPAKTRAEGPAAAALLAAGFGAFVLGLLTFAAEASTAVKEALVITEPVGPLSGKTTYAVAAWLVAWIALHAAGRRRLTLSTTVVTIAVVLGLLGLLGTFPVFFQLFAPPE